jgi:hypothetical protein
MLYAGARMQPDADRYQVARGSQAETLHDDSDVLEGFAALSHDMPPESLAYAALADRADRSVELAMMRRVRADAPAPDEAYAIASNPSPAPGAANPQPGWRGKAHFGYNTLSETVLPEGSRVAVCDDCGCLLLLDPGVTVQDDDYGEDGMPIEPAAAGHAACPRCASMLLTIEDIYSYLGYPEKMFRRVSAPDDDDVERRGVPATATL